MIVVRFVCDECRVVVREIGVKYLADPVSRYKPKDWKARIRHGKSTLIACPDCQGLEPVRREV